MSFRNSGTSKQFDVYRGVEAPAVQMSGYLEVPRVSYGGPYGKATVAAMAGRSGNIGKCGAGSGGIG